jgi:hypothetical protein
MEIYAGKLVIELVTSVNSEDEETMTGNAHAGLSKELFEEIKTLLGASGYMMCSMGSTLTKVGDPKPGYLDVIKKHVDRAKKDIHWLYNKSNVYKTRIE